MSDNHAFGLRAQVAHRQAEFTGGPTMSDVMADLDLFPGEPTNAVAVLAACRAEQDAHHDELFKHLWRRS
ncbi:hypothetical protein ABTZ99_22375 [Actinosynnema sp. NPDC002837]